VPYGELPEVTLESGAKVRGVLIKNLNPPKTAVLRLPSSQEVLDRIASQRSLRTPLGRGKSESTFVPNYEAEFALFSKLRLDAGGDEFDQYEAAKAIARLLLCDVTACERDGEQYHVTVKTPFGETVHFIKMPTEKDIAFYRRVPSLAITDMPRGKQEVRYRIGPAIELYDSVAAEVKGYADPEPKDVPPHHKSAVVIELMSALDELEAEQVPNF
jgi:hypothetical protein